MRIKRESLAFVLIASILVIIFAAGAVEVQSSSVPLCFIQNNGQIDEQALYFVDAPGFSLYLTGTGEVLYPVDAESPVVVTYDGSNPGFQVTGEEQLTGTANFFIGNDAEHWVIDVPTYASVRIPDLYEGISLVYSVGSGTLKREFIVDPGATPGDIMMMYSGQESLSLDESGAILIGTSDGVLFETAPVCYQIIDGIQTSVPCGYAVSGDSVSFSVGAYDPAFSLVIDPILDFSTYFGGSAEDIGAGIGLDDAGNIYIVGSTKSTNLPLPNDPIFQEHINGSWDIFVAKTNPDGNTLLYSTYIGGNQTDMAGGIAVNNSSEEVFITGYTLSSNYPETLGATTHVNLEDVVITGLDQYGSALIWSRYFAGNKTDEGTAITYDSAGNPVVVGFTNSENFPGITFDNSISGSYDGFIVVFNIASGIYLNNPHYLGGSNADYANGVATDSTGNLWVTGSTKSTDFPTTSPVFRQTYQGQSDAFVTEFGPSLGSPVHSTYLGGKEDDYGTGIAIGPGDYPYVTGYTESGVSPISLFPIKPHFEAFQDSYGGGTYDAFITKMETDLSAMNYSTYLGGNYEDRAYAIAVDDMGNAYVTGWTDSTNFPLMNPYQAFRDGLVTDVFVTEMNTTGTGLVFSTYFGGTYYDKGNAIAISGDGLNITFTGFTESHNFPLKGADPSGIILQPYLAGYPPVRKEDAFISKFLKVPPIADFYGVPTIGCSPLMVNFTDNSTGDPFPVTAWLWDFGDGNTSPEQNPVHTYYNPDPVNLTNFTVNLTVWNQDGMDFISKVNYTTVCPALIVDFHTNKTQGCIDNASQNSVIKFFDDTTPAPLSRYWDFGDGTNKTTASANTNHNYTQPGVYNVSLTAIGTCCNNTTTKYDFITIGQIPVADFNATPTKGFLPLFVQFYDNSIGNPTSWAWRFPLVEGTSTEQNPNHTYTVKNNYTVKLYACNFCGCSWANKSQYIKVGDPLIAGFTTNKTSGFAPLKVGFFDATVGTPDTWFWDFDDGTNTTRYNNATFSHTFTNEGVYNVTLNVSNFYGYDVSDPVTISVGERATVYYTPGTLVVPTNTTTRVNLTLSRAVFGLAGYNITVWWDDSANGNFTTAKFPDWASLTTKGPLPAPSVDLKAVDLNGDVDPGATDVPLAYFNVTGLIAGDAFLKVTIHEMTDDIGGDINPKVIAAKVSVENLFIFPGKTKVPKDPFDDQIFWDVNGNGRIDFNDVVTYFQNMQWIRDNQYIPFFDYNGNGNIDFNDLILLFQKV